MFHMIQVHSWSFSDIENMIPWERDIYLIKLNHWIEEENDKNKEFQRKQQHG
tara:strand:- start:975 stop:1130 length:156 start_codon:yes stop_codon:yes gene_type:complete